MVHASILEQCDRIDGVADAIIEDPLLCNYRPEALQCTLDKKKPSCLTVAQVLAVRDTFSPYYGVDGSLIFPRMQPGSELSAISIYYTGKPFPYTTDWYRYAILGDPAWNPATLNAQDAAYAYHENPSGVDAFDGDLSAFKGRGGKILHYHGQADQIITSDNSPRYYDHVSNTMKLPSEKLDDFYRFFRISGMGHCAGGNGAWEIGQTSYGS